MSHPLLSRELPAILEQAEKLPSLPAVALEVLRLTEDENSTLDELAGALEQDPALSAKLLKLANSSLFGVGAEITTLQRATMVLGMKTVKLMSLSFSLVSSLPRDGEEEFHLDLFWRHSLVGAVVGRNLAKRVGSDAGDEAFLCGLLGSFGKLALARCLPERYAEVLSESGPWPTVDDEERILGFHSADLSAALLQHWGIPALVCTTVAHMTKPAGAPADMDERSRKLLDLMAVAHLGEMVLCGENGNSLQELYERAASIYGLEAVEVEGLLVELEPAIRETAEMLSVPILAARSHGEILESAREKMMQISLGTAVDLHQERRRNAVLADETRSLRQRATTDALTGIPNRAAFDEMIEAQVQARLAGEVSRGLGLILIDVDKFKSFNDTYGHQVGDEVLRMVGGILQRITREEDLAARYGGEEFAVVVPHTTPYGLRVLCERLRQTIEAEGLEIDGRRLSVTASLGAACITGFEGVEDGAHLVRLADRLLYRAKENGRNRSEIYPRVTFPGR